MEHDFHAVIKFLLIFNNRNSVLRLNRLRSSSKLIIDFYMERVYITMTTQNSFKKITLLI